MRNRRSIRMPGYDYGQPGVYYVSIGTHRAWPILGHREGARVVRGPLGRLAEACWIRLPEHFPGMRLDLYSVMPNHLHGLIVILAAGSGPQREAFGQPTRHTVPTMVRSFKAATTRMWREMSGRPDAVIWQGRYLERVIRSRRELASMRVFVRDNLLWHRLCDRDSW